MHPLHGHNDELTRHFHVVFDVRVLDLNLSIDSASSFKVKSTFKMLTFQRPSNNKPYQLPWHHLSIHTCSAVEVGGRLGAEPPFFKLGGGAEPPFYFRKSRIY
jgi:hypothetical protein